MLFGVYYITSVDEKLPVLNKVYSDDIELMYAMEVSNEVDLRQLSKVRIGGKIIETTLGRIIFNKICQKIMSLLMSLWIKKSYQSSNQGVERGA